jgi:hypothetical protein
VKYELGFYIPEDDILHSQRRENSKSYMISSAFAHFIQGPAHFTGSHGNLFLHPEPWVSELPLRPDDKRRVHVSHWDKEQFFFKAIRCVYQTPVPRDVSSITFLTARSANCSLPVSGDRVSERKLNWQR